MWHDPAHRPSSGTALEESCRSSAREMQLLAACGPLHRWLLLRLPRHASPRAGSAGPCVNLQARLPPQDVVSFPLTGGTDREGPPSTTARPASCTRTLPALLALCSGPGPSKAWAAAASTFSDGPTEACAACWLLWLQGSVASSPGFQMLPWNPLRMSKHPII
jgi:hypothetical protein